MLKDTLSISKVQWEEANLSASIGDVCDPRDGLHEPAHCLHHGRGLCWGEGRDNVHTPQIDCDHQRLPWRGRRCRHRSRNGGGCRNRSRRQNGCSRLLRSTQPISRSLLKVACTQEGWSWQCWAQKTRHRLHFLPVPPLQLLQGKNRRVVLLQLPKPLKSETLVSTVVL